VVLTLREFQLLQLLLDHPHRYFSTSQIMSHAWADPGLFPRRYATTFGGSGRFSRISRSR
jgi:DNA-binding response OmpR family regulator